MIDPSETEIIGACIFVDGEVRADEACRRIEWLTTEYLIRVANSVKWGDWETLFQDPRDGRYWERTFPQGQMQGGGPPRLKVLGRSEAQSKYQPVGARPD